MYTVLGVSVFLSGTIGSPFTETVNVASVTNPSTGIYVVTLTEASPQSLGIGFSRIDRADMNVWAEYTAANQITISARAIPSNALGNLPNGTKIKMFAFATAVT